jgi:hypothetical protein
MLLRTCQSLWKWRFGTTLLCFTMVGGRGFLEQRWSRKRRRQEGRFADQTEPPAMEILK